MNDSDQFIREAIAAKYRGIVELCSGDLAQRHRRTLPLTDAEWTLLEDLCSSTARLINSLSITQGAAEASSADIDGGASAAGGQRPPAA